MAFLQEDDKTTFGVKVFKGPTLADVGPVLKHSPKVRVSEVYLFNYCGKLKVVNLAEDPFICLKFNYAQAICNLLHSLSKPSTRDRWHPIDLGHMMDCIGRPLSMDNFRVESALLACDKKDLFLTIDPFLGDKIVFTSPSNAEIREGISHSLLKYTKFEF